MDNIKNYIKLLRPHHYIKNILILLPIIFSKNIFKWTLLKNVLVGFAAFSIMASIVYILNDVIDIESDRKHEKKRFRPIASGKIPKQNAVFLAIALFIITIFLNYYIKADILTICVFYCYLVLNILYSIKLKHVPIVDVVILAIGFMIRVIYGALITSISISNWLYITILAFSFYMGLGKRRNEYKRMGTNGRRVLNYYNESFLNSNMYMCMALGIVFYSLWCMDIGYAVSQYINIIWTVPLVIIICMKYSLDVESDSLGDPVDVFLEDKSLMGLSIIYSFIMLIALYV